MAANFLSIPAEYPLTNSPLAFPSTNPFGSSVGSRQSTSKIANRRRAEPKSTRVHQAEIADLAAIWGGVLETLPQGVIVVSRSLKPVFWNLKAKSICSCLAEKEDTLPSLPTAVSEICHRFLRANLAANAPLVMEYRPINMQVIRISARWLHLGSGRDEPAGANGSHLAEAESQPSYILIFMEDCKATLREELRIEQQKYDLTDREAEIWMLLRQEYSYQEIAKMLQISLNTVKTHVKNVYAKRRSQEGQEKFWCCE